MGMDIIARGMAANATAKAQQALDELAQVIEGRMSQDLSTFEDLDGNVVTPSDDLIYCDVDTYSYYRWNGNSYYEITDPRDNVKYSQQNLDAAKQYQARQNISASMCRTGTRTLDAKAWVEGKQELLIDYVTVNDYVHIVGASASDSTTFVSYGIDYELKAGKIEFTATSLPESDVVDIELRIAIISGVAL